MVRLTTMSLSQATKRFECSILSDTKFVMYVTETLLHI
jgi:hypothetical protein